MTPGERKLIGLLGAIVAIVMLVLGIQAYVSYLSTQVGIVGTLEKDIAKMRAIEAALPAEAARLADIERRSTAGRSGDEPKDIYEAARIFERSQKKNGLESERAGVSGEGAQAIFDTVFKGNVEGILSVFREISAMRDVVLLSARIDVNSKGGGAEARLRMKYETQK